MIRNKRLTKIRSPTREGAAGNMQSKIRIRQLNMALINRGF